MKLLKAIKRNWSMFVFDIKLKNWNKKEGIK